MTSRTKIDKIVTLLGVFQCLTLLLPLGFYAVEPPPSYVGTLWGFLVVPTYITFLAGLFLIFRDQIQTHLRVKVDLVILLAGIMTSVLTFFSGILLYPLTQTLIVRFHQIITHSGPITYLDVESGGIFRYLSLGVGFFCLGLGLKRYLDRFESLSSAERLE
ncbi:MAG: hypothetical protein ACFFC6_11700 [Promethearchaeota archaeon]